MYISILSLCISFLSCFLHCHKISLLPSFVLWSPPPFLIYYFLWALLDVPLPLGSYPICWLLYVLSRHQCGYSTWLCLGFFSPLPFLWELFHSYIQLLLLYGLHIILFSIFTSFHISYPIFPPEFSLVSKTVKLWSSIFSTLTNYTLHINMICIKKNKISSVTFYILGSKVSKKAHLIS